MEAFPDTFTSEPLTHIIFHGGISGVVTRFLFSTKLHGIRVTSAPVSARNRCWNVLDAGLIFLEHNMFIDVFIFFETW